MTATATTLLRRGDARDVDTVAALMTAAFDARYGEAWTRNQCMGVIGMPQVRLTMAYVDDAPAGFAMMRTVLDESELLLLAVAPAARRAGVGGALVRSVITDAETDGATRLHLEVRAGNVAITLYEQHRFKRIGIRPRYYRGTDGEQRDAHTFVRDL